MNKTICKNCDGEVSNDFNNTLSYCTSCGANINFSQTGDKTLSLNNKSNNKSQPNSRLLLTIILTSLFTAAFVATIFLVGSRYLPQSNSEEKSSTDSVKKSPTPRQKSSSSISASEITKVVFNNWRHEGPVSAPGGRVVSDAVGFSSNGDAFKTETINYDDGSRKEATEYKGSLTKEQFEKLAQIIVENDFLNEPDSTQTITESQTSLTVIYTTGEKKIITGNIGKNTPEVENILRTITALRLSADWKIVK